MSVVEYKNGMEIVSNAKFKLVAFAVNAGVEMFDETFRVITFAFVAKMFVVVKELLTAKLVRRPTLVMFGCAATVTLCAVPTVETFEPLIFEMPDPLDAINRP